MEQSQAPIPRKLWEHPDPKSTLMWRFVQEINEKNNQNLQVSSTGFDAARLSTYDSQGEIVS